MRLLSLDYGRRRIGIAGCSGSRAPVVSLATLDRKKIPDIQEKLHAVIANYSPEKIIIGLPLHADESESEMSEEVRTFFAPLLARMNLPVSFIDEHGSSQMAQQHLQFRKKKHRRDKAAVDKIAACIILQRYLDEHPF